MLRQTPSNSSSEFNGASVDPGSGEASRAGGVNIQRELDRLEEVILDSPRIPLSRRTLVDEVQLLDQLDLIRMGLPAAFHEAEEIVRRKDEIFLQAERYAQEMIEAAERRAAQILDEMGIVRQAEQEAQQIWQRMQQECDAAREQTIAEIDRMQRQAQQDMQDMQRRAIAEAEEIQNGADEYADSVLRDMEHRLSEMMRIVRNGRQQLQSEAPPSRPRSENTQNGSAAKVAAAKKN
jgi:hypothetical protein